jgi:hypothetical protein
MLCVHRGGARARRHHASDAERPHHPQLLLGPRAAGAGLPPAPGGSVSTAARARAAAQVGSIILDQTRGYIPGPPIFQVSSPLGLSARCVT